MSALPIVTRWDGEAFRPIGRSQRECDDTRIVGEVYRLADVHDARSRASHNHFFAVVAEIWATLPDDLAERFQSQEALRKFALIKCGYATQIQQVGQSHAEAKRMAALAALVADEYVLCAVDRNVVTIWKAKSMQELHMGRREFQEVKDKVFGFLSDLVGASRSDVEKSDRED